MDNYQVTGRPIPPKEKVNTLIINFFGESCTGKSKNASGLYAHLKEKGVSCELVREYIKDFFYDYTPNKRLPNQMLITGKQIEMTDRYIGAVKVIITDSPILLGAVYANMYGHTFLGLEINNWFNKYNNFNILLRRDFEFVHEARGSGKKLKSC